jgi:hypothetical protein
VKQEAKSSSDFDVAPLNSGAGRPGLAAANASNRIDAIGKCAPIKWLSDR